MTGFPLNRKEGGEGRWEKIEDIGEMERWQLKIPHIGAFSVKLELKLCAETMSGG